MDPSVLGDKAQTGTLLQLESGSSRPLEFVAVGHVTLDEQADSPGWCVGGAALYAASAARSLGLRAGIVTAAGVDFPWAPLSELAGSAALGNTTTRFQNDYHDGHRRQRVLARAEPIEAIQITRLKRNQTIADDAITLYCPVAQEFSGPLESLSEKGLCGVSPQGFMRRWDSSGVVSRHRWEPEDLDLDRVDVVSLSEEDLDGHEVWARELPVQTVTITRGASGADVIHGRRAAHVPTIEAAERDPTGAGDIFVAVLLIALREGRPPIDATRYACCAASLGVEGRFMGNLQDRASLEARYRQYRREVLSEINDAAGAQNPEFEAYCQAVEQCFFGLKGRPGQLSPRDFALLRRWYEAGWDIPVVARGIENAFREQSAGRERESEGINTLAYCEDFVREVMSAPPSEY